MKLFIQQDSFGQIKEDLEQSFPFEGCGFMFGQETEGQRTVLEVQPVINTREENRERRFEIGSHDYLRAESYALEKDLLLLGVYHSHPNHPAIPSQTDLNQAFPYFSYTIVSVQDGKLARATSWRLNEELKKFDEETLLII